MQQVRESRREGGLEGWPTLRNLLLLLRNPRGPLGRV